jgi:hypothetical protein
MAFYRNGIGDANTERTGSGAATFVRQPSADCNQMMKRILVQKSQEQAGSRGASRSMIPETDWWKI